MRKFDYAQLLANYNEPSISKLVSEIYELKGRFSRLKEEHPHKLEQLQKNAFINNVDSSAKIEGIVLERKRIEALLKGSLAPVTSSDQEIIGYAHALNTVHNKELLIESGTLVDLYEELYAAQDLGDRSRYRQKDYVYTQIDGVMQAVPVSPIAAFETPLVLGSACDSLCLAFENKTCSLLMLSAVFTVDFLCIRPFNQGNGRLVRLFVDALLQKVGFDICSYLSIDALIEKNAIEYYDALNSCVMGWDTAENTYEPFIAYWLKTLKHGYELLIAELENAKTLNKGQRIVAFVQQAAEPVSKRKILESNPDISEAMVENVLGKLVKEGTLSKIGAGRSTAYRYNE